MNAVYYLTKSYSLYFRICMPFMGCRLALIKYCYQYVQYKLNLLTCFPVIVKNLRTITIKPKLLIFISFWKKREKKIFRSRRPSPTVTVKCKTAIKALFLYTNLCLSVKLDSLSCSFTSISFLTNQIKYYKAYIPCLNWYVGSSFA